MLTGNQGFLGILGFMLLPDIFKLPYAIKVRRVFFFAGNDRDDFGDFAVMMSREPRSWSPFSCYVERWLQNPFYNSWRLSREERSTPIYLLLRLLTQLRIPS